jgi:hypothetical protein
MSSSTETILSSPEAQRITEGLVTPEAMARALTEAGFNLPPMLRPNISSSYLANLRNIIPFGLAAASVGQAIVNNVARDVAGIAYNYFGSLMGNAGDEAQEQAVRELIELEASGETQNEGLKEVLQVAEPGALRGLLDQILETSDPQLGRRLTIRAKPGILGIGGVEGKFGRDLRTLGILAPGMDAATARVAVVSDLAAPQPKVAELYGGDIAESVFDSAESAAFTEMRLEQQNLERQGVLWTRGDIRAQRAAISDDYFFNQMDTDSFTTLPDVAAKTRIYAGVETTDEEIRRNELLNIINTANEFNQNQEIELMEDEFLAEIQEKRIKVNQRPVPTYAQVVNKFSGLQRPIYYSPYVQQ